MQDQVADTRRSGRWGSKTYATEKAPAKENENILKNRLTILNFCR